MLVQPASALPASSASAQADQSFVPLVFQRLSFKFRYDLYV